MESGRVASTGKGSDEQREACACALPPSLEGTNTDAAGWRAESAARLPAMSQLYARTSPGFRVSKYSSVLSLWHSRTLPLGRRSASQSPAIAFACHNAGSREEVPLAASARRDPASQSKVFVASSSRRSPCTRLLPPRTEFAQTIGSERVQCRLSNAHTTCGHSIFLNRKRLFSFPQSVVATHPPVLSFLIATSYRRHTALLLDAAPRGSRTKPPVPIIRIDSIDQEGIIIEGRNATCRCLCVRRAPQLGALLASGSTT